MKVIMRSDNQPDVGIEATEYVQLDRLDQHIRTLLVARRWLKRETDIRAGTTKKKEPKQ